MEEADSDVLKELPSDESAGNCFSTPSGACSSAQDETSPEQEKWARILQLGIHAFHTTHPDKFQRRLNRGVPAEHRWQVWKNALYFEAKVHPGRYTELCGSTCKWAHLIDMDTPRTCFGTPKFDDTHRESLRRVLYAYSIYNPEVGYCQGMNFIVGILLLVSCCAEEETFWMFACLMEDHLLHGFYQEKFPLLHRYLHVFGQLVESQLPELGEHFRQENLQPSDYLQQWFLTLFVNVLPLPAVLIIWDSIMCKGLPVLLHTTVVLLKEVEHVLMAMNFEDIMKFFRDMKFSKAEADAVAIGQMLMKRGSEIKIPPGVLQQLVSES